MRPLTTFAPIGWMTGASLIPWLCATMVFDRQTSVEVLWGMLGPLAMVCGTWVAAERTVARNREGLMAVMAAAFFGKMVFSGAYFVVMLRVLSLRPTPFVASFTGYFIALYLTEALLLKRLFSGRDR